MYRIGLWIILPHHSIKQHARQTLDGGGGNSNVLCEVSRFSACVGTYVVVKIGNAILMQKYSVTTIFVQELMSLLWDYSDWQ